MLRSHTRNPQGKRGSPYRHFSHVNQGEAIYNVNVNVNPGGIPDPTDHVTVIRSQVMSVVQKHGAPADTDSDGCADVRQGADRTSGSTR